VRLYGQALGVRIFRKHLAAYVERGPGAPPARRAARAELCRLDHPTAIERALVTLWSSEPVRLAA
jgi:hypothetical protein